MMNTARPDVVLLGNLLVDDIVLRDGQTLMGEPGGAVLHAALAAALWGAKVGICSVAGTDYPSHALEQLAAKGINLAGVRRLDRTGGREAFGGFGFIGHGCAPASQKDPSALKDFRVERQLARFDAALFSP